MKAAADSGDADSVRRLIAEARTEIVFQLDGEQAVRAAIAGFSEADLNL